MAIADEMEDPILCDANLENEESSSHLEKPVMNSQQPEKITCTLFLKSLTIEPFMVLFMISYIIGDVCTQNIFIDKACLYIYKFPANVCDNIDNYTDEKVKVQKTANNYNLYSSLVETVPAIFFTMVIGPWSDKHGRKLPIVLALIGSGLKNVGIILNIVYFDAPLYWMIVSAVPAGIFGGFTVIFMCLYSLISEQTSKKRRTIKYAFLDLAFGLGAPIGTFIGGMVYKQWGYVYVYMIGIVIYIMALMWLIIVIKDIRNLQNTVNSQIMCDLFRFQNFKESFEAVTKPRPNGIRLQIWLLIGSMCCLITTYTAMSGFSFYFVKLMYNWDVTTYSNFKSTFVIVGIFSVILVISVFIKFLRITDYCLGLIGSISMLLSDIIKGFAYKTWMFYLGNAVGAFGGISLFAVRSRLSKIVSEEELGKIFAFLSSCESLVPVVGTVIFAQIFNASIHVFPGLAYITAGVIIILPIVVFPWIGRKSNLENESQAEPSEQSLENKT